MVMTNLQLQLYANEWSMDAASDTGYFYTLSKKYQEKYLMDKSGYALCRYPNPRTGFMEEGELYVGDNYRYAAPESVCGIYPAAYLLGWIAVLIVIGISTFSFYVTMTESTAELGLIVLQIFLVLFHFASLSAVFSQYRYQGSMSQGEYISCSVVFRRFMLAEAILHIAYTVLVFVLHGVCRGGIAGIVSTVLLLALAAAEALRKVEVEHSEKINYIILDRK